MGGSSRGKGSAGRKRKTVTVTPRTSDDVDTPGPIVSPPTRRLRSHRQLDASPGSLRVNDVSGSSSSSSPSPSQQQQNAQTPSPDDHRLVPFIQRFSDIMHALESHEHVVERLKNDIRQFLQFNVIGLPNDSEQNTGIDQALDLSQCDRAASQQENRGATTAEQLRGTMENFGSSASSLVEFLSQNPLLSTVFGNTVTDSSGDGEVGEVDEPTASTSQRQSLDLSRPDSVAPQLAPDASSPSIPPPSNPPPSLSQSCESDSPHHCPLCSMSFPASTDLTLHRYNEHSFLCPKCQEKFLELFALEDHLKKKHSRIMTEQDIEQELEKFRRLFPHPILSPKKYYTCPRCLRSYERRDSFQRHMKSKHNVIVTRETAASYYSSELMHRREQFQAAESTTSDNNTLSTHDSSPPQPSVQPQSTGIGDTTASTSQQQNPGMQVPLGNDSSGSSNAPQQNLDGNPPDGSSQINFTPLMLSSMRQFLNTPGVSIASEQNTRVAQALERIRQQNPETFENLTVEDICSCMRAALESRNIDNVDAVSPTDTEASTSQQQSDEIISEDLLQAFRLHQSRQGPNQ